jgi:hypothetical protein
VEAYSWSASRNTDVAMLYRSKPGTTQYIDFTCSLLQAVGVAVEFPRACCVRCAHGVNLKFKGCVIPSDEFPSGIFKATGGKCANCWHAGAACQGIAIQDLYSGSAETSEPRFAGNSGRSGEPANEEEVELSQHLVTAETVTSNPESSVTQQRPQITTGSMTTAPSQKRKGKEVADYTTNEPATLGEKLDREEASLRVDIANLEAEEKSVLEDQRKLHQENDDIQKQKKAILEKNDKLRQESTKRAKEKGELIEKEAKLAAKRAKLRQRWADIKEDEVDIKQEWAVHDEGATKLTEELVANGQSAASLYKDLEALRNRESEMNEWKTKVSTDQIALRVRLQEIAAEREEEKTRKILQEAATATAAAESKEETEKRVREELAEEVEKKLRETREKEREKARADMAEERLKMKQEFDDDLLSFIKSRGG